MLTVKLEIGHLLHLCLKLSMPSFQAHRRRHFVQRKGSLVGLRVPDIGHFEGFAGPILLEPVGECEDVELARQSIEKLIKGYSHKTVYRFLEVAKRGNQEDSK